MELLGILVPIAKLLLAPVIVVTVFVTVEEAHKSSSAFVTIPASRVRTANSEFADWNAEMVNVGQTVILPTVTVKVLVKLVFTVKKPPVQQSVTVVGAFQEAVMNTVIVTELAKRVISAKKPSVPCAVSMEVSANPEAVMNTVTVKVLATLVISAKQTSVPCPVTMEVYADPEAVRLTVTVTELVMRVNYVQNTSATSNVVPANVT